MLSRLKILAPLIVLVVLVATGSVRAQGVGLALGANFNELSDIDTGSSQATFENASGWHVHLWLDLPVGPVAVRPGLRYMDAGEVFQDATIPDVTTSIEDNQVVSLLEIPIDVRIRMNMPLVTPYVMAGPILRFPTGDDEDRLESFSFAGGIGAGVELGLAGVRLFPELKYTFGVTRFTNDSFEIGGVDFSPDEEGKLNAIMLSLGVGL